MPERRKVYELDDPDLPPEAHPLCLIWNVYPLRRKGYIKARNAAEKLRRKIQEQEAQAKQERLI